MTSNIIHCEYDSEDYLEVERCDKRHFKECICISVAFKELDYEECAVIFSKKKTLLLIQKLQNLIEEIGDEE